MTQVMQDNVDDDEWARETLRRAITQSLYALQIEQVVLCRCAEALTGLEAERWRCL